MRENSECGKQCRSESMRAELRLLRQPFFFLLFYFFPITLHIFRPRHLKAHSSNGKQNVTSKVKCRCFKLHRHISVQFFGVSFRRVLPSLEKGKESKMSFAYASIKSKIRKYQVVLECTAKRITECLLPCDLHTRAAVVVIA